MKRAVVALAVLAAACSSSHPGPTSATSTPPTGVAPSPTTTTSSAARNRIIVGGTDAVPNGSVRTTTTTALRPVNGGAGGSAAVYLRPAGAPRLVIDVRAAPDIAPRQTSIRHLESVLATVSAKAVGLTTAAAPSTDQAWSDGAIDDAAGPHVAGTIHVLFLHGTFQGDDHVLGISVRDDVCAVFSDQVTTGTVEEAVTTHELGHLLGLVDLFLHTGRAVHDHHSPNPQSVMYYAVESSLVGQLLNGPPPTEFDAADRADLATIRNG